MQAEVDLEARFNKFYIDLNDSKTISKEDLDTILVFKNVAERGGKT